MCAATPEHDVVDRWRVELIEPGLPSAPIHHEGGQWQLHDSGAVLDDDALATLVEQVRASVVRSTTAALDELVSILPAAVTSLSLRDSKTPLPTEISMLRRVPYESRADAAMYRHVLAELASERDWTVHGYDATSVEADALSRLGERSDHVLRRPREKLGTPWSKDHRIAFAATIIAV